jgi:hypothetical protein
MQWVQAIKSPKSAARTKKPTFETDCNSYRFILNRPIVSEADVCSVFTRMTSHRQTAVHIQSRSWHIANSIRLTLLLDILKSHSPLHQFVTAQSVFTQRAGEGQRSTACSDYTCCGIIAPNSLSKCSRTAGRQHGQPICICANQFQTSLEYMGGDPGIPSNIWPARERRGGEEMRRERGKVHPQT